MKINEVEERVGVSKANIRFYEKQGLLNPARGANGYRVYGEEDILVLQQIVILRKLGLSVEQIGKVLSGELPLQEAVASNIVTLKEQIEQLNGSLELSKQIVSEGCETLDTPRYWNIIHQKEAAGQKFTDILNEYWVSILEPTVLRKFGLAQSDDVKKKMIRIALICVLYAVVRAFFWKDGNVVGNLLYWPMIFAVVAMITFPLFLLALHHPRIASALIKILMIIAVVIVGGAIVLAVGGLLVAAWNTVFS